MQHDKTERLTRMIMAGAVNRALSSVAELGIADLIEPDGTTAVAELASASGAHERSLFRILRFLASHGLFTEHPDRRFGHSDLSRLLRSDAEGSFRPGARMFHAIQRAWDGLHHSVLTGEPGFQHVFGKPLFDYLGESPEVAKVFDAGMTAFHGHETSAMLDAYDFSGIEVLADIGGGNGSLLVEVLGRNPSLKGLLFDLEHVTERARERLRAGGIEERCTIRSGSFFDAIPEGADAYLFRHIIHDWTDEQSVQILRNCRDVIPDHGRLLIVEFVIPAVTRSTLAIDADITMMVFPGGLERTEKEYAALFEESGFRLTGVTPTAAEISVVEGRPA